MAHRTPGPSLLSQVPVVDRPARRDAGKLERGEKPEVTRHWTAWLGDPRSAVLLALSSLILIGGGRRLLMGWRSRKAVERLQGDDPTPEEILEVAKFGRDGLIDLFRLLETAKSPSSRVAAGKALVELWKSDDLIIEEEKALLRRGAQLEWAGRRRYPRDLTGPIELSISMQIPFLESDLEGAINNHHVQWSYKITGAHRASLEEGSPWKPVNVGDAESISISPGDFAGKGPHRLILQPRLRTVKLKENWEFELPHLPFSFEFDPILELDAIFATDDDARSEAMATGVVLTTPEVEKANFVSLNGDFVLRNPPGLAVVRSLPCDLAHRVEVELEGIKAKIPAGKLVVTETDRATGKSSHDLNLQVVPGGLTIERPGAHRMRAHLIPDAQIGWAHPEVRSIWPRQITTEWAEVQVVRR